MAVSLSSWNISSCPPEEGRAFASGVCGEPVGFARTQPNSYWAMMPEQAVSRHFTLYGLYRNTIWVALGVDERFCLARYEIAMRRHDCAWPFPYCNRWSWESIDEVKLVERIRDRPKVPPGVTALFPGECATGELASGETAVFHVEIPSFGQALYVTAYGDSERDTDLGLGVQVGKVGQAPRSPNGWLPIDDPAGGTYEIRLLAPWNERRRYVVRAYWGHDGRGCSRPPGWRRPPHSWKENEEAAP